MTSSYTYSVIARSAATWQSSSRSDDCHPDEIGANVQYPCAYTHPYRMVKIEGAERGTRYFCYGCDRPMVARLKGDFRAKHFAHKAGYAECRGDDALHKAAVAAVVEGFLDATKNGKDYRVSYPCPECRIGELKGNVATPGASIATERSAVRNTRADLVIYDTNPNKTSPVRMMIEIVLTHDLEEATASRYEESRIPVVKVKPTWDTVPTLLTNCRGYEALNVPDPNAACSQCSELKASEARRRELVAERLKQAGLEYRVDSLPRLEPIIADRFGNLLYGNTKTMVNSHARNLQRLGFVQQKSRPSLFRLDVRLPTSGVLKVYADLGGTEVMKIWEANEPALYAFPLGHDWREDVLDGVSREMGKWGFPHRRHFPDVMGWDRDWYE